MDKWFHANPDSKVHGTNMGPSGADRTQVGPHVGPMNFAIWEVNCGMKLFIQALQLIVLAAFRAMD